MKSICFIVPYFGKLPPNFQLWLNGCKENSTIVWKLYTDDHTDYVYPTNVEVNYCTFDEFKGKIQDVYEFKINIDRPWKLCDFRVAYGEILADEIEEYDFWGHCDMDVMWGDIRSFLTEEILDKYEKIGFQGHCTIYKNNKIVNERYKVDIEGIPSYKEIFTSSKGYCYDENIICDVYERLGVDYYRETNFAHLSKFEYGFYLWHLPKEFGYKNKRQVFLWHNGKLTRYYIDKDKSVKKEDFMYIHFFCRPMSYKSDGKNADTNYLMYPDVLVEYDYDEVDYKTIKKYGHKGMIMYYVTGIWHNRKKITIKKIINNVKLMSRRKLDKLMKKY